MKPTESELEILQILWKNGSSTVRSVNEELNKTRVVGYTTTLKLMQIMAEKGLLKRKRSGKSHIYFPSAKKEETQKAMLDKIISSVFGGSAANLVMQALGNKKTSEKEIFEIRKLLDQMERENKNDK